jgi:hypothetical protein
VYSPAGRGGRLGYSVDQFLEIAERSTVFEGVIASTISDVLWTGEGDPQRLRGNHGTFNTFDVMGVRPLLGRTPTSDDARPGAEPVVILGYRFWQRQSGGDRNILGRQLRLNDTVRTVIGVMPKRFMWRGADVYLPLRFERGKSARRRKERAPARTPEAGRQRRPGGGGPAAHHRGFEKAATHGVPRQLARQPAPVHGNISERHHADIWVLFGAVALLLLIACATSRTCCCRRRRLDKKK